ncbi:hypothetical protein AMECASPLE_029212 [Ameca splendens]|uniref:Serine palmitoyltransferase n=1 Tax=Ameca splendens TaxID=208324 RepID=A0ABV0ZH09_9TELE
MTDFTTTFFVSNDDIRSACRVTPLDEKEKLKCLERKVALTLARYLEKEERFLTPPSIRVVVTIKQKDDDIQKAVSCIREAASVLLK